MKKSNLIKIISIVLMSLTVILFNVNVYAADSTGGFKDITETVNNSSSGSNLSNTNTNNTNTNTNANTNTNTNANKVNNSSSIYNNTNLPKTGIGDAVPVAMLVVVFGISAVYAYKKIRDYQDI